VSHIGPTGCRLSIPNEEYKISYTKKQGYNTKVAKLNPENKWHNKENPEI
jgi:hypothetical protein